MKIPMFVFNTLCYITVGICQYSLYYIFISIIVFVFIAYGMVLEYKDKQTKDKINKK